MSNLVEFGGDSAISDFKTPCRKAKLPRVICSSDRFWTLPPSQRFCTKNRPRLATNFMTMIHQCALPSQCVRGQRLGVQRRTANGEAHSKHPCAARRLLRMALLHPAPVLHSCGNHKMMRQQVPAKSRLCALLLRRAWGRPAHPVTLI